MTIFCCTALLLFTPLLSYAQTLSPTYARIAVLRPHDGKTVEFESGYIRHLEWHRQAGDKWGWYGWTLWASERQRWFVYATFGHTANSFDNPVSPAEDEKDNILNVVPHCEFVENGLYEFLPALSRGNGIPQPLSRVQLITIELNPGDDASFEKAVGSLPKPEGELLWFKLVAGADLHRYVCLRGEPNLSGILNNTIDEIVPHDVIKLATKVTVEILALRPQMSYGVVPTSGK